MVQVLIAYHSRSGRTKVLAEAIAEGARAVPDTRVRLRPTDQVSNRDLAAADAIIVGSPTYFGQMAAEVKRLFDASNAIYGQLDGKVGGAFTTAGEAGGGHETTLLSILNAMLIAGMVVRGHAQEGIPAYGPFAIQAPDEAALTHARRYGARTAALASALVKGRQRPSSLGYHQANKLAAALGNVLRDRGWTVATAESCTGGLTAHLLTNIPGSSDYYLGSVVAYANEVKRDLLGVPEDDLRSLGAVSEPIARAMARGVRHLLGADVGLATTGIAGPSGGTPDKPVGTVYLAVSTPNGDAIEHHIWTHDRAGNKLASARRALAMALELLQGKG